MLDIAGGIQGRNGSLLWIAFYGSDPRARKRIRTRGSVVRQHKEVTSFPALPLWNCLVELVAELGAPVVKAGVG